MSGCDRSTNPSAGFLRLGGQRIVSVLLFLLLSACVSEELAEREVEAATDTARPAMTESASPDEVNHRSTTTDQEPEPTLTRTPRPPTKAPTYTPEQTATQPVYSSTPTEDVPCYEASFLQDVTYRDGARVTPGEIFLKVWRFRNEGSCPWTNDFVLDFVGGERFSGPDGVNAKFFEQGADLELRLGDRSWNVEQTYEVLPGETTELAVVLRAPLEEGRKRGFWRVVAGDGESVVLQFYVDVDVAFTLEQEAGVWSGEWQHESEWNDAAGNPLVLRQQDRQVEGYYYSSDGEVFLLEASLSADKTRMRGSFGQAWQNGWPFVLKLYPDQKVFTGYYNDSDFTAGAWCGSRQGYDVPLGECLLIE